MHYYYYYGPFVLLMFLELGTGWEEGSKDAGHLDRPRGCSFALVLITEDDPRSRGMLFFFFLFYMNGMDFVRIGLRNITSSLHGRE